MEQLSELIHLFYYRRQDYDGIIVPVSSGCAQLFRIPFGELKKEDGKAVLGNIDFFPRPHLDKKLVAFTAIFSVFEQMCKMLMKVVYSRWHGMVLKKDYSYKIYMNMF